MLNVTFINNDISASQAVAVLIDEKLRLETSALQLDQHIKSPIHTFAFPNNNPVAVWTDTTC